MAETPPDIAAKALESRKAEDEARIAATALGFRRRAGRVRLARRVLPLAILVLAAGTVGWIVLRSVMSDQERKAQTTAEIRLDKPLFHGQDEQGRSFTVGAQGAVRDAATGRFRLVGPAVKLDLGAERVTELTADGGTYDEASRRVIIGPNVRITDGASGFKLVTPEAVIDTRTGVVTGDKGVQGAGPLGTINASSYVIRERGRNIQFGGAGEQKVRGTINLARSDG